MAETAEDVLDLASLKNDLRIDTAETDHDNLLRSHRASAISFVDRYIRTPLIDSTETRRVIRQTAGEREPICLEIRGFREVESVTYWTSAASIREAPDGEIESDDLGWVDEVDRPIIRIHPGSDGWPSSADRSDYRVTVKRGWDPVPDALAAVVVLLVRQLYDGYREMRATEAFFTMIRPFVVVAEAASLS